MTLASKPNCQSCRHQSQGVSHGYLWQECKHQWSDGRPMIGVVQNLCRKFAPRAFAPKPT